MAAGTAAPQTDHQPAHLWARPSRLPFNWTIRRHPCGAAVPAAIQLEHPPAHSCGAAVPAAGRELRIKNPHCNAPHPCSDHPPFCHPDRATTPPLLSSRPSNHSSPSVIPTERPLLPFCHPDRTTTPPLLSSRPSEGNERAEGSQPARLPQTEQGRHPPRFLRSLPPFARSK